MCCKATKRQVSKKHRTQSSTHLPRRDIALVDAKYPSANYWSGSMHRSSKRAYVRKLVHDVDSQTLLRILLHALYCPVFCQTLPSTEGGELLYCTYYTILYFSINIASLYYIVLCYSSRLIPKNLSAILSYIFELLNTEEPLRFDLLWRHREKLSSCTKQYYVLPYCASTSIALESTLWFTILNFTSLYYSTHYCCTVLWHGRALTSGPSFCSMLYLSLDFSILHITLLYCTALQCSVRYHSTVHE